MADLGRRLPVVTADRRLSAGADVQELADARLVLAKELRRSGRFEAPPAFSLEIADVVTFGENFADDYNWRVVALLEEYGLRDKRPFYQAITLRGVA